MGVGYVIVNEFIIIDYVVIHGASLSLTCLTRNLEYSLSYCLNSCSFLGSGPYMSFLIVLCRKGVCLGACGS